MRTGRMLSFLAALLRGTAQAAGGPLGIDHELSLDQSGIWARKYQTAIEFGVIAVEAGGAVWLGDGDPLGHAFWQTLDSSAVSAVAAQALKYTFGRARPDQGGNPDRWFQGTSYQSFPSGEVTLQASFVTPLIVRYAKNEPWIWTLELYDSIARMKSRAHWQTDVIAGWALGSGIGYWATTRETPITVQVMPRGLSVGISKRF